jgi:hypothetical protein
MALPSAIDSASKKRRIFIDGGGNRPVPYDQLESGDRRHDRA